MQIPHPQIEVTVADFWQVGFEITIIMILKMEKNGQKQYQFLYCSSSFAG